MNKFYQLPLASYLNEGETQLQLRNRLWIGGVGGLWAYRRKVLHYFFLSEKTLHLLGSFVGECLSVCKWGVSGNNLGVLYTA